MKVADAVREYVVYKQSLGMSYKGRALKLNAFARFVGPIGLEKVTPEMARNFLDGHGAVTTDWFNKFWVLNTFFRFAIARGYATENPLPRTKPKSPREFRPYIYSVEEVKKMIQVVDCRHRGRWPVQRFSKLPVSTACYSESMIYVRRRVSYSGQEAPIRQQLCNQVCNWSLVSPVRERALKAAFHIYGIRGRIGV